MSSAEPEKGVSKTENLQGEDISDEMIDFLRSKAFNDDFKSLVNKVVFEDKPLPQSLSPVSSGKASHIRELQKLFYKTVNLSDKVFTGYNPLGAENETVYEYSLRYLGEELKRIGLHEYALLCYDPSRKSFTPTIFTIEDYNPVNMTLAPEDPLYRDVINEAVGITIEPSSRIRDDLRSKHFVCAFEEATVFMISVQNILNIFWAFSENNVPTSFIPTSLYPIFAAILRPGQELTTKQIVKTLQQKLAFAFYILHNNLRKDNVPPEYRTPAFLSALVDTYCRIYGHLDSTKCFVLKHSGRYSSGCYFFINYLWRQISSLTGPDSTAVQIEKDRIVLFLSPDDQKKILQFIEAESSASEGNFTLLEIESFSNANLFDILSR